MAISRSDSVWVSRHELYCSPRTILSVGEMTNNQEQPGESIRKTLNELMRSNRMDDMIPMRAARFFYDRWAVRSWHRRGEPVPPPYAVKRRTLREYAVRFGLRMLVETGTFYGDTSFALRNDFERIVSIELDRALYERAKERLKPYKQIAVLQGDSGKIIANVMKEISQAVLFWLDAHYSGGITARGELDSPIFAELDVILTHPIKNHVILIDDARDFTGTGGYPTVLQLRDYLMEKRPDLNLEVRHDVIRIHRLRTLPPQSAAR